MSATVTTSYISSGYGGAGGASVEAGAAGDGGYSYVVYDADVDDGVTAEIDNISRLVPGKPGAGGVGVADEEGSSTGASANVTPVDAGQDGESGETNY